MGDGDTSYTKASLDDQQSDWKRWTIAGVIHTFKNFFVDKALDQEDYNASPVLNGIIDDVYEEQVFSKHKKDLERIKERIGGNRKDDQDMKINFSYKIDQQTRNFSKTKNQQLNGEDSNLYILNEKIGIDV